MVSPIENTPPDFLNGPNCPIAYRRRNGLGPGTVWLGGFRSDMLGTKADFIDQWALGNGRAFLRFDYTGHGESSGRFEEGCISQWASDGLAAFDNLTDGPQILIGSSMGAWTATLLAKQRTAKIAGAIFIAPAPDFTEMLMWPNLTDDQRNAVINDGFLSQPSDYSDEPEILTRKLFDDGRTQCVLGEPLVFNFPVVILQGMRDEAVPYDHAVKFANHIQSDDLQLCLSKTGDHRLSEPDDLTRLALTLDHLISKIG